MTRERYPNCCRNLFTNCDGILSCIAPFGEDVADEMCLEGKGYCEFRINRWTGKDISEGAN